MTTQTLRRGGLDWSVPKDGRAADAFAVASTTSYLLHASPGHEPGMHGRDAARHATRLHVISGLLWKLATRETNGEGGEREARREASLVDDAIEIARHYGLCCHFGGLVDGGLVIGTSEQLHHVDPERHGHVIRRLGS